MFGTPARLAESRAAKPAVPLSVCATSDRRSRTSRASAHGGEPPDKAGVAAVRVHAVIPALAKQSFQRPGGKQIMQPIRRAPQFIDHGDRHARSSRLLVKR